MYTYGQPFNSIVGVAFICCAILPIKEAKNIATSSKKHSHPQISGAPSDMMTIEEEGLLLLCTRLAAAHMEAVVL